MNQQTDDNLNLDAILELGKPLSLDESDEIIDKLLSYSYNDLMKNEDGPKFFEKVFNNGLEGKILTLRDLMVAHFYGEQMPQTISQQKKDGILKAVASQYTDANTLLGGLKQVDPIIELPAEFDLVDYQGRAAGIYNAIQTFKRVIAEKLTQKYANDVMVFLKYSPEILDSLLEQIEKQYEHLEVEYKKLIDKTDLPSEKVLANAIDFLTKCGRTPMQIQSMKEDKNLGEITQLYLKIERSIHMAIEIQKKNPTETDAEKIRQAIVDFLISDTHL